MPFLFIEPEQRDDVPQPTIQAVNRALNTAGMSNVNLMSANLIGMRTTYTGPYANPDGVFYNIYHLYTDGYKEPRSGTFDEQGNLLWY